VLSRGRRGEPGGADAFLIVATVVVFAAVVPLTALMKRLKEQSKPEMHTCPECLKDVPVAARRRVFCTSEV